jgi:anaerobic magnesium-protoporphyrin IX monomethyl ester cyclase
MNSEKGKITLIATDIYGPAMGTRFLSSVLREAGFDTTVIFAQGIAGREVAAGEAQVFPDHLHDEIAKLAEGSLFVGISLLTPNYHKARELTEHVKKRINIPVIWGGVHVTVKPEECLQFADLICIGEGEQVIVELAGRLRNNAPYTHIPGLMLPGQPLNDAMTPVDIIHLPKPDYSFDGSHYLVNPWNFSVFTLDTYTQILGPDYFFAPTRGCPYQCTYCINNKFKELYKTGARFRSRDLQSMLNELIWMKQNIPVVHRVIIDDDCFMALKADDLRAFATEYKRQIGLPYVIRGAHPQNITEEKLNVLCVAGLTKLRVGIQTGSDQMRGLYKRSWETNAKIVAMANLVHTFIRKGLLNFIMYDIIVDTPWETEDDRQKTLDLILSLKPPFGLYCFSMTFYPGIELYDRALSEGLIQGDTLDQAYWFWYFNISQTPVNQTFEIMKYVRLPAFLIRFLANPGQSAARKYIAELIRGKLDAFTQQVPEIGLFFGTLLRYEADFHCTYNQKQFDLLRKEILKSAKGSQVLIAFRRLLGTVYLKFFAPGKLFGSAFYRNQTRSNEEERRSAVPDPWRVSLTLRVVLHP